MKAHTQATSRRRLLGGAAAVAALAALSRGVSGQESSPEAGGEWTFTDDLGVTVTLPARPTRIVADLNAAAPLWDFGIEPIAVSGWTVATDASWGNVDRDTPVINAEEGMPEPSIEALIELDAELFVTISWGPGDIWSFSTTEAYEQTQQVVPVLAISVVSRADEALQRFADLSVALGADLESPELIKAKEVFDASVEEFSRIAEEKSDLTTFFASMSVNDAGWYAAYAPDWSDLMWYRSLGLNIVDPEVEPGAFWENVSHEEAGKYPTDVLFNSTRAGTSTAEELLADPLFAMLPSVASGQIGPWNQDFILSYQGMTDALKSMTETLAAAEKVTE